MRREVNGSSTGSGRSACDGKSYKQNVKLGIVNQHKKDGKWSKFKKRKRKPMGPFKLDKNKAMNSLIAEARDSNENLGWSLLPVKS
jgi:hypothetical protein